MKNKKTIAIATAAMSIVSVVPAFAATNAVTIDVKYANSTAPGASAEYDKLVKAKEELTTLWGKTYHPNEDGVETKRYIFKDKKGHDLNEIEDAKEIEKHLLECQQTKGTFELAVTDKMQENQTKLFKFVNVATAMEPIVPVVVRETIDYRGTTAKSRIEQLKAAIKEKNLGVKVFVTKVNEDQQTGTYVVKLYQATGYKYQIAEIEISFAPLLGNGIGQVVLIPENNDFKNHWAADYIKNAMLDKWIAIDAKFRPNDSITRAEFVRIVNNAYGFSENDVTSKPKDTFRFNDINPEAWYYKDVIKAVELGYISGYQTVTTDAQGNTQVLREFKPNAPITREEAAAILGRVHGVAETRDITTKFTDDKDISVWADESVAVLNDHKIINGYAGNEFKPKNKITRAESIVIMSNAVHSKLPVMLTK